MLGLVFPVALHNIATQVKKIYNKYNFGLQILKQEKRRLVPHGNTKVLDVLN